MKRIIVFAVLLLISLFFFNKTVIFGLVPFPGDILLSEYAPWKTYSYLGYVPGSFPNKAQYFDVIRQLYPWKVFAIDQIKSGQIPLWNPYNFSGSPLLANHQSSVFYPLNILFFVFSDISAWTLYIFSQVTLAALFMYLYVRKLGISLYAGLLSSVSFAFSLYISVFLLYGNFGHTILWLPYLLYFVERLYNKFTIRDGLLFSLGVAFSAFAGHLQLFSYLLLFVIVYFSIRVLSSKTNVKKALLLFVLTLFGIGISSIQLIPTFELASFSARAPHAIDKILDNFLIQPVQLILFLIPDIFGNPATRNYLLSDSYPGNSLYIGLVGMVFALFSIRMFRQNNFVKFYSIAILVLLLFLVRSPLTQIFYSINIPFISSSSPANGIFLLSFSLSVLAGFGLETWLKNFTRHIFVVLTLVAFFIGVTWMVVALIDPSVVINQVILSTGMFVVLLVLISTLTFIRKEMLAWALIIFVVLDLFYFFNKFNPFVPVESVFPDAKVFSEIKAKDSIDRFWGYGAAGIEANFATQYRLYSPDGYDPLYPKNYGEFIYSSNGGKILKDFSSTTRSDAKIAQGFGEADLSDNRFRLRIFDVLGVKYILDRVENGSTEKTFPEKRYSEVYNEDGWKIFENKKVLPRYFLSSFYEIYDGKKEFEAVFFSPEFDPRTILLEKEPNIEISIQDLNSSVELVSYNPNQVVFKTNTQTNNLFFLSDNYSPGWKAFIDNSETEILKAHYSFRAITVPSGEHVIEFVYRPKSFSLGLKVTIISSLGLIIFLILASRHKINVK